jgi:hypothetical protein
MPAAKKAKGNKIVMRDTAAAVAKVESNSTVPEIQKVLLHLKCSMKELEEYRREKRRLHNGAGLVYSPVIPPDSVPYSSQLLQDDYVCQDPHNEHNDDDDYQTQQQQQQLLQVQQHSQQQQQQVTSAPQYVQCTSCIKRTNTKIKTMKLQLYKNKIREEDMRQSACFWCTCSFVSLPCCVPLRLGDDDDVEGYGHFCMPECAAAYLFCEGALDDSTKMERYHLLNAVYGKAYGYEQNVKPAPDPHYLLDKFLGTLTIDEYRAVNQSQQRFLHVVHKPFTRILPELHEENEEILLRLYGIEKSNAPLSGTYKVCRPGDRRKDQVQSKHDIMMSNFGLQQESGCKREIK